MRPAIAALLAVLAISEPASSQLSVVQGPVEAVVERVTDGDTIDVKAMAWPDEATWRTIRIRGIDTPEIRGKCQYERDLAQLAKRFLETMISANNNRVALTVVGCNSAEGGGFGRCLSYVDVAGLSVTNTLIAKGLARENHGQPRSGWCPAN
jgi:micrococcal nuclease